jgi:hypothetical protein
VPSVPVPQFDRSPLFRETHSTYSLGPLLIDLDVRVPTLATYVLTRVELARPDTGTYDSRCCGLRSFASVGPEPPGFAGIPGHQRPEPNYDSRCRGL